MPATSPLDMLQNLGAFVALPQPAFPVGTRVNLEKLSPVDARYFFRKGLREHLRKLRETLDSLADYGIKPYAGGKRLHPHNKGNLRLALAMVLHPDSVELAGSAPSSPYVCGNVGNQCYLQGGQCHTGVEHCYHLLFRKKVGDNDLVFIHPLPVLPESTVRQCRMTEPANQPVKEAHATAQ